jgi:hypothetical protein
MYARKDVFHALYNLQEIVTVSALDFTARWRG